MTTKQDAMEAAARALTPVLHGSQEDEHGVDLPPVQFDDLPPDWQARHIEYVQVTVQAYLAAREAEGAVFVQRADLAHAVPHIHWSSSGHDCDPAVFERLSLAARPTNGDS